MTEPLWSNERIEEEAKTVATDSDDASGDWVWQAAFVMSLSTAEDILKKMRDEYEIRLAELTESMRVILSDDDSPADKYYHGFNDGVEFAKTEQAHVLEQRIAELERRLAEASSWTPITVDNIPDLMMSRAQLRRADALGYEMSYRRTTAQEDSDE